MFDDIALAHREIYALYEIAQAMGTSLGVADTMALISAKLSNLVPFSCAALFLFDEETETLRCRFATGTDAEIVQQIAVRTGEGLTGWVARNRRALVNARPSADLEAAGLAELHTNLQSALVCPLLFNERFIGTLSVYHVDAAFYRDDHRRLLDRVSEQAAAVINNSMLFEQTQEDSLTDPLTGLPNTRFLFMHLTRELARAERLKSEVSLMVMDLDNFKEINDTHGHHVGDHALCEVARVLRTAIRPYDICVRYAGDEFIVVLSGCGADEAEHKRQELQTDHRRRLLRSEAGEAREARHQRGRRGLPAGRRIVRSAARDGRQPDVPGQVDPQAQGGPRADAPRPAGRGAVPGAHRLRHPASRGGDTVAAAEASASAANSQDANSQAESRPRVKSLQLSPSDVCELGLNFWSCRSPVLEPNPASIDSQRFQHRRHVGDHRGRAADETERRRVVGEPRQLRGHEPSAPAAPARGKLARGRQRQINLAAPRHRAKLREIGEVLGRARAVQQAEPAVVIPTGRRA